MQGNVGKSRFRSSEPAQIGTVVQIVTPENIAFAYEVAGPWRRAAAWFIDLLIRAAIVLICILVASIGSILVGRASLVVLYLGWFVLTWFYGSLFEAYMNGQTPGKLMFGMRVVTTEGQPINGLQATLRNVIRDVDLMPPLSLQVLGNFVDEQLPPVFFFPTAMLGLIVMTLNPRFQRLGDIACGTMVIIEERHRLTGVAKFEDARTSQLAELIPPDFQASRTLSKALAIYVDRRRFFSTPRRKDIARHLAEPLLARFGFPPDTSYDLLMCALYYRTFVSSHGEQDVGTQP